MAALDAAFQSAAALGVTISAAAGDNGSSDGVNDGKDHVDFPASSPHVLACGGTNLQGPGSSIPKCGLEWPAAGRRHRWRHQRFFPLPNWQARERSATLRAERRARRPDVAGVPIPHRLCLRVAARPS